VHVGETFNGFADFWAVKCIKSSGGREWRKGRERREWVGTREGWEEKARGGKGE